MGHIIEVFITGCPLCQETIEIIKKAMCPKCTLRVYNVLENPQFIEKAKKYNIKALPAIVIDGKKWFEGVPEFREVKEILRT